jgi:Microsomal signal peptidase 12 kDa subunit (SPC12)
MDYQGQQLAEILFHLIILSFGSVGWVMGYMEQNFMIVFKIWLVGVVLSVLVGFCVGQDFLRSRDTCECCDMPL